MAGETNLAANSVISKFNQNYKIPTMISPSFEAEPGKPISPEVSLNFSLTQVNGPNWTRVSRYDSIVGQTKFAKHDCDKSLSFWRLWNFTQIK